MGPARINEGWRRVTARPPDAAGPRPTYAAPRESIPSLINAIHGQIGDRVYKTYRTGRIVVTGVPCFDGYTPSAAQRAQRDRMRAAIADARRMYADPAAKALDVAEARRLGRVAFRLAISDHLAGRPPGRSAVAAIPAA